MIRGALFALVGMLVISFNLSAEDKPVEKPGVKKEPAVEQPIKKPAADQPTNKPAADSAEKKPTAEVKARARKEGAPDNAVKGRLESAAVADNVLTLKIDGKDYEFAIEGALAMVRSVERDGKTSVVAVQLMQNQGGGEKAAARKEQLRTKPGAEPPKKIPAEKAPAKTPEKKPE